jgi:hypothetical protein
VIKPRKSERKITCGIAAFYSGTPWDRGRLARVSAKKRSSHAAFRAENEVSDSCNEVSRLRVPGFWFWERGFWSAERGFWFGRTRFLVLRTRFLVRGTRFLVWSNEVSGSGNEVSGSENEVSRSTDQFFGSTDQLTVQKFPNSNHIEPTSERNSNLPLTRQKSACGTHAVPGGVIAADSRSHTDRSAAACSCTPSSRRPV